MRYLVPLLLALSLVACQADAPPTEPATTETTAPDAPRADSPEDPPFDGTTDDTRVEADHTTFATLMAVRFGEQDGFERVTLEFDGDTMPGYIVNYTDQATQCGSGHPVETEGEAVLRVQVTPARAHTDAGDRREPTIAGTEQAVGQPILREAVQVCDHHGGVEWALGLAEQVPYRVLTFDDPARLVVDLRRP